MRKILFNTVALAFRSRPKMTQLTTKLAFTFMAYPIIRHGFQNVNMSDHYELNFEDDLKEGEMREFQVGPQKEDAVLVCKVRGKLYCVSNACSHAGAPLSAGFLVDDKVKCPWHNASFSVIDGSLEEGPMLNGIQTFEVQNVNGQVSIKIQKDLLNKKRQLNMFTKKNDNHHIVIVGGGIAGQSAAETLRQTGFEGKITIVNNENHLPYDRTPMSKFLFQFGAQGLQARNQEFYDKYGIDILTNTTVEKIDIEKRIVHFGQNELKYDKLLIATGGSARRPAMDGVNLQNVHTLRTMDDAQNIRTIAKTAKNIVIVGASFIGMETASALKKELKDQVNITIVDNTSTPFERVLGTEVGSALQQLHESNGINFELLAGVKKLSGQGEVQKVELLNGKSLLADVVILGTGIIPNNSLVRDQLKLSPNGGIETDVFLKAAPNVYVAGDIASYPYWVTGDQVRIEHQNEAIRQGHIAAFNLLGKPVPMIDIPFFWTRQWDRTLAYSGVGNGFDEVIIDGNLKDLKFIAYYARKGQIVASASMNVPNAQMIISEAMRLNILPTATVLRESKLTLDQIKQQVIEKSPSCACKRTRLNQHKL